MKSIKFIHTADLHLDTPFKGLSMLNNELAKRIKDATFKAFEKIIDKCLSEKVDFLLIAGDVFDRESKSLGAQLEFAKQLKRLSQNGIWTFFICGNHDPLSSWMPSLDLPDKVHRFGSEEVEKYTFKIDDVPVADIYGISYKDKAITENISLKYNLDKDPAHFSIALLHGNLSGNTGHDNYAPFTLADLTNKDFDYWALGHIHLRQVLNDKHPFVAYPGNPQGRDFGEKGVKGCFLVELSEDKKTEINIIETQLVRFEDVEVDLTDVTLNSELDESIRNGIERVLGPDEEGSAIVRLKLKGRTSLHKTLNDPSDLSSLIANFNANSYERTFKIIDSIRVTTLPILDFDQLREGNDFIADILVEFEKMESDLVGSDELFLKLSEEISSMQFKREIQDLTPVDKREILQKAKIELLDKLITE